MKQFTTLLLLLFVTAGITLAQTANNSHVDQSGSQGNSIADVNQVKDGSGDGHQSTINQNSGFLNASVTAETGRLGHVAEVDQTGGVNNFSDILQQQNQAGAFITQTGSNNESRLKQAGFGTAEINQDGDDNRLGSYTSLGTRATDQNSTSFYSNGTFMYVDQIGNRNKVGIDQRDNTLADIDINGDDNETYVDQFEIFGDRDHVNIDVTGDFNYANVSQSAGGNSLTLSQTGDDHTTILTQSDGSTATISQGSLAADVNNVVLLDQTGAAVADITQEGSNNNVFGLGGTGTIGLSLNGSTLAVDQIGDGNELFLDQSYGNATVMQNGTTNVSTVVQN